MSLSTSFNDLNYEQEEFKPFSTPSPTSQSSPQSSSFQTSYVNASTSSPYSPHGIPGHGSGWQSHMSDPRMTRPRSTYPPVDPLSITSTQRHQSRADSFYSGMDSGSYGMRRTPSSSPPYPSLMSSGHYTASSTGQYHPHYSYAPPLPSHHSMSGPASTESRCEWGPGRCDVALEDTTPAGIARHLRQYHDIAVTDNRNRGMCAWGGRCGKDMFPSSFGKHIAECHLRNMTKQCPYCRADFARADTLSRHIKAFCPHTTGGGGGAQAHPHTSG
ncbi:hypothetical protein GSI_10737 [Ganoderma sinense ZZ0214-1]|uniref:Uncharacterized protein n=1 Tax=Ganoderma sinense ZZ0214-1 TaxID=1077348 RepID=A0A2G8S1E2_9APHY|nr:hypothetical protein GSI_10737 [Ganoderma sinense ZZ0214-1]